MNPRPLTISANYLAVARGLHELHRLSVADRQDSPEADAVRDVTDVPWQALTEVEKKRLSGLSEDLYSITDPAQTAPREMNPQAESRLVEAYVEDLESAIQSGSILIWTYFFLAHHNLAVGLFERCRAFCERALEMKGSDALKSELAEWLAISQSELGYPADVVRQSFDRSISFDPANERARRNLASFAAAVRPIPASIFETRDKTAVRVSGLSERRSRPAA